MYLRAIEIRENTLGPNRPYLATSLDNYARLLRQSGREDEAVKLELRAVAIRKKAR